MGLNIKNERTVTLVRELAQQTGQSQTSAVEDAVTRRLAQLRAVSGSRNNDLSGRKDLCDRILSEIHSSLPLSGRNAARVAQTDLYDELGLPQ